MNIIFETIDITRRKIYLTSERFKHIMKHPIMQGKLEFIKETLERPHKIIGYDEDKNVGLYFRYYKNMKQYLFISVKYLNGKGFIITSFYTDKIR